MATLKRRTDFYTSEEGKLVQTTLTVLLADEVYNTEPTYSAKKESYPDGNMPFIDRHMQYLEAHPMVNVQQYLSNLRLMIKQR
jgi:hypothetical protein